VLRYQPLAARRPGPGEVRIRQTAVGVNYIDVYVRSGLYRMIEPPAPLGMEAAGVVVDVGDGVAHLLPGDHVAYACPPVGAYVGARTMPADQVGGRHG
jgi:NADPH:quinone reductase-like Zn-dependent oxidoreductase